MKKIGISILLLISLGCLGGFIFLWVQTQRLQKERAELERKTDQLKTENKTLVDERRRASIDMDYYKNAGKKLQEEKRVLDNELKGVKQKLEVIEEVKESDIQALKVRLKQLKINFLDRKKAIETQNIELIKENEDLKGEMALLESTLKELNAMYFNNMGIAYTRAQVFDKAIEAYEKSIDASSSNAEAYYNLGLLYQQARNDLEKARFYFEKYRELIDDPEEKGRVSRMIEELSTPPSEPASSTERPRVDPDMLNYMSMPAK